MVDEWDGSERVATSTISALSERKKRERLRQVFYSRVIIIIIPPGTSSAYGTCSFVEPPFVDGDGYRVSEFLVQREKLMIIMRR